MEGAPGDTALEACVELGGDFGPIPSFGWAWEGRDSNALVEQYGGGPKSTTQAFHPALTRRRR